MDQKAVEQLREQWPKPRVGERVKLHNTKHIGEVVAVRGASDVLRSMREVRAMRFGPDCQATYGPYWMDIYYQADIVIQKKMKTIEPRDVEKVLPPD